MDKKVIAEIREKLKRGILEMLILQLLSEEDMYGYQIKQEINRRTDQKLDLGEYVLYPPLYRMIKHGYISERKETVCQKRVRVYYHLEDAGRECLGVWKQEYTLANSCVNSVINGGMQKGERKQED